MHCNHFDADLHRQLEQQFSRELQVPHPIYVRLSVWVVTENAPEFAKLRAWVVKQPDAESHFVFHRPTADVADSASDFINYAVKSQILQGFTFLANCEKLLSDLRAVFVRSRPEHPFPSVRHLILVSREWQGLLAEFERISVSVAGQTRKRSEISSHCSHRRTQFLRRIFRPSASRVSG
jgi:hypothetical protein